MAAPTMECPSCNRRLVGELREDHTYDFACASCGWGNDRLDSTQTKPDIRQIKWRVFPYWVLSLFFVAVGYKLLNSYVVAAFNFAFPDSPAREFFGEATPWLIYFTVTLPIYLLTAWVLQPESDMDDLGWFGGLLDRPGYTDNYNRLMLFLEIFLWPGKFMIFTVQFTRAVLRGK